MLAPSGSIRLTHAQRKVVAEIIPDLAGRLLLETTNQRTLQFKGREIEAILRSAKSAISHAENGTIRNPLRLIIEAANKAIDDSQGINAIPAAERLFQFKITLLDIKPAIWRRIQVPDCTLGELHEFIQGAMGWWNYHLHQFEIDGERYGPSSPDGLGFGLEMIDEDGVRLSDLLPKSGKKTRWVYEYDFGDGRRHEVVFEGYPPVEKGTEYPICLEGERACPPEDCGGPWGFPDYLDALADPEHEQHDELLEWRRPFDPDAFDAKQATKAMRA